MLFIREAMGFLYYILQKLVVQLYLQLNIRLINTSGVYFRLHLGDPAFIQSPAFNRVNTVIHIILVLPFANRSQLLPTIFASQVDFKLSELERTVKQQMITQSHAEEQSPTHCDVLALRAASRKMTMICRYQLLSLYSSRKWT